MWFPPLHAQAAVRQLPSPMARKVILAINRATRVVKQEGNSAMNRLKKILCWTAGSGLLLVFVLFALLFWSMRPTKGPKIGKYPSPRTALLIIDIQEDYTGPQAKKRFRAGDRIVGVSNALLAQAQANGAVRLYQKCDR